MSATRYKAYPAYKDSGVEWLGEIPSHWTVNRLKYLASVDDEALAESTDPGLDITYVDIGGVDSSAGIVAKEQYFFSNAPSRARRVVRHGDVIVSTVRTYLRAVAPIIEPEPNLVVSTGFAVVRPRDLDQGFAAYVLRAPYFVDRVVAHSVGVSYPAINASEMVCFPVGYPELHEQRAIAVFLDRETARIDALVAKKERLIELLQEKRTALISHAVTKGLDSSVPMKDSGVEWLGEIPEHWGVNRLKHVGDAIIGLTYDPGDIVGEGEGALVLRASNISEGRILFEDNVFVRTDIPRRLFTREGDILICSRSGSRALIGKSAMIDEASAGLTFGTFMTVFRSRLARYLFYVLNSSLFAYQSATFLTSTINQLTLGNLRSFAVPMPPAGEQRAIAAFLDRETATIDTLVEKVREGIERLREYRTALISATVTGKIDVRNESAVPE